MKLIAAFDSIIVSNRICSAPVQCGTVLGFMWHPEVLTRRSPNAQPGCAVALVLNDVDGRALMVPVQDCKFNDVGLTGEERAAARFRAGQKPTE